MALSGTELVQVQGVTSTGLPAGGTFQTTAASIAALAAFESTPIANTTISTAGDGTLTAASLTGRLITRTGTAAPFTDTTDTAALIIAALPSGSAVNSSFEGTISNTTAFPQALSGGAGVILAGVTTVPAFSYVNYLVTYAAPGIIVIYIYQLSLIPTTAPGVMTTAGNSTITGALFQTNFITRSGPVAAFTDTTDSAANIILATGYPVGASAYLTYKNSTAFLATLVGGTGVTFSGGTSVPANSGGNYIYTRTGTATVLVTNYFISGNWVFNASITNLNTVGAGTITAAGIVSGVTSRGGAQLSAAFTDTTATANQIVAAFSNLNVGESWLWTYRNTTNAPATLAGGSGVTVSTITIIQPNSYAEYLVTLAATSTITIAGFQQGFSSANGTFTATGTTSVTVNNSAITTASQVGITLKSVGGTVGSQPYVTTITTGTGFTVASTVGDTSVYNYSIQG